MKAAVSNPAWMTRENNFDCLRLALAVVVIYSHGFPLGVGSEEAEPLRLLTHGQATLGAVAVNLFFIMSGFLITASAERSKSALDFLKKRALRIYPAFLVSAVLLAVVVVPLAGGRVVAGPVLARGLDFVDQTLRLKEFHSAGAFAGNPYPGVVNGSVWSIQYEFWCYIGVLLLWRVGMLRRRVWVLVLFVTTVALSVGFEVRGWVFGGKILGRILGSPQLWARLLPLYLAGVAFYLYREKVRLNGWVALSCLVALAAACWVPFGWALVFPFAGTYAVFYVAYAGWIRLHHVGRFGDFSYGTYLYAFPVEQLIVRWFGHAVSPGLLFACATPLTLVVAVGSWYGVERWVLVRVRQREAQMGKATLVSA